MRHSAFLTLALVGSTGCMSFSSPLDHHSTGSSSGSGSSGGLPSSSGGSNESVYVEPPDRCRPSASVWAEVRALHRATESSVHELVTCGGMQTSLSRNMMAIIIASNRDLFDEQSYEDLVRFAADFDVQIRTPFEPEDEGVWTMDIPTTGDSSFDLVFSDPKTGERIVADPFKVDTYVTGAQAATSMSFSEMKERPWSRNTITFTWEDEGPLSSLLAYGGPVDNPFTMRVSLMDLGAYAFGIDLASGSPDFGPFESVLDTTMTSTVDFHDERGEARIDYRAAGLEATIRHVADRGVGFDLEGVDAAQAEYQLTGRADDLRYIESGSLAGVLTYTVEGPGVSLIAESDFGEGAAYPDVRWRCAE